MLSRYEHLHILNICDLYILKHGVQVRTQSTCMLAVIVSSRKKFNTTNDIRKLIQGKTPPV